MYHNMRPIGQQIHIKQLSGDIITLDMDEEETIASLKSKLISKGIPGGDRLELVTVLWERLDDKKEISSSYTTLHILYGYSQEMRIIIETVSGKMISMTVDSLNTIDDVLKTVHTTNSSNTLKEKLMYNGELLDETKTLAFYKIQKDAVLNLVEVITINVKTLTDETIKISCDKRELISRVITKIHENGVPLRGMRLMTDDWTQLGKRKRLSDYNIEDDATLRVIHCITSMQVHIKMLSGEIVELDVKPSDTIAMVKSKMADIRGIAREEMKLITNDWKVLDYDDCTLSGYCVQSEDTLHLVHCESKAKNATTVYSDKMALAVMLVAFIVIYLICG